MKVKMKTKFLGVLFFLLFLVSVCFVGVNTKDISAKAETTDTFQEMTIDFSDASHADYFVRPLSKYRSEIWTIKDEKFYPYANWNGAGLNIPIPTAGEKYISLDICLQPGAYACLSFLKEFMVSNDGIDYTVFFNGANKYLYAYNATLGNTNSLWMATEYTDYTDGEVHNVLIKIKDGVITYRIDGVDVLTGATYAYDTTEAPYIYLAFDSSTTTTYIDNIKFIKPDTLATSQFIDFSEASDANYFVRPLSKFRNEIWTIKDEKFYPYADWNGAGLNLAIPTVGEKYLSLDISVQPGTYVCLGFLKEFMVENDTIDHTLVFDANLKTLRAFKGSLKQSAWQATHYTDYGDGQVHNFLIKIKDGVVTYKVDGVDIFTSITLSYDTTETPYIYLAFDSSKTTTYIDNIRFSDSAPAVIANSQSIDFSQESDKDYFVRPLSKFRNEIWTIKDEKFYPYADWNGAGLNLAIPTTGEIYLSLDICMESGTNVCLGFLKEFMVENDTIDHTLVFLASTKSLRAHKGSLKQGTWLATRETEYADGQAHNIVVKIKDGVFTYKIDDVPVFTNVTFSYDVAETPYVYLAFDSSKTSTYIDNIKFSKEDPALYKQKIEMVNGASIRLSGEMGLRFETTVQRNERLEIVSQGTLMIPNRLLTDELTLSTEKVLNIPMKKYYSGNETSSEYSFTGVLTKIPTKKYNEDITARAYIVYKVIGSDEEITVYSNSVTRNVAYVAERALEDAGKYNATECKYLRNILTLATGDITLENFDENTAKYSGGDNVNLSIEKIATDLGYGLRVMPVSLDGNHILSIDFAETEASGKTYIRTYFSNSGTSEISVVLSGLGELTDLALTPTITSKTGETLSVIPAEFDGYLAWEIPAEVSTLANVTFTVTATEGCVYYTFDSIVLTDNVAGSLYEEQKTIIQQQREIENILDVALYTEVEYKEMSAYSPTSLEGYEHIKAITYDGILYNGGKTKVFAYIGFPENASKDAPVPAMVLVHGGGGHPYLQWVKAWNDRGYAAIAMETTGYFPKQGIFSINESNNSDFVYGLSSNADFVEDGYVDSPNRTFPTTYADVKDHWATHGLAYVTYAHNILRQDERVDNSKIGITGVSWGGVTTSLMIGYDTRYAVAMPVYGTAYLSNDLHAFANFSNGYVHSLWAAEDRLDNFKNPILWWAYNEDTNFAVPAYVQSYQHSLKNNENNVLVMLGNWSHSHGSVFGLEDQYSAIFADSVIKGTTGFVRFNEQPTGREIECSLNIPEGVTITGTTLYYINEKMSYSTFDKFGSGSYPYLTQYWQTSTTAITVDEDGVVSGTIPEEAKGYYFNVHFTVNGISSQVSSVFVEIE